VPVAAEDGEQFLWAGIFALVERWMKTVDKHEDCIEK
jgi:hypothetical protein